MASEGKGKLKRHDIEFQSKSIDSRRFAYDIIKYSVSKFHVPDTSVCLCKHPENNYGCSEFCLVMFRIIFHYQIQVRYSCYTSFNQRYELNKLESFALIGGLLQDVIDKNKRKPEFDIIDEVQMSLSIACELVLFLHSKELSLCLKELADFWFSCYFRLVKKRFQKAGGLDKIYLRISIPKFKLIDSFDDEFISKFCLPYEDLAKYPNLRDHYNSTWQDFFDYLARKRSEETEDIFIREFSREDGITEYEIIMLPVTSEQNEASGIDASQNTRHGTPQTDERLRAHDASFADATPSQKLPEASFQERSKQNRVLSARERIKLRKSRLRSRLEQGLGQLSLDSSRTEQSSEKKATISVASYTSPSQSLAEGPKEPAKDRCSVCRQPNPV